MIFIVNFQFNSLLLYGHFLFIVENSMTRKMGQNVIKNEEIDLNFTLENHSNIRYTIMKKIKYIPIITFLIIIYFLVGSLNDPTQKKWVAPASADKIINPIKTNATTIPSGKKNFA